MMLKFLLVAGVVAASGIVNPTSARQADLHVPADTLKSFFNNCIHLEFGMPVFKPDTELTESMPQLKPPTVDERMIIPQLKNVRIVNSHRKK